MDPADRVAYLARIGHRGATEPSPAVLADLQLAYLLTVPFENLSIHTGEEIQLRLDWLFDKLVRRRRGGFCYELNGRVAQFPAVNVCSGHWTVPIAARTGPAMPLVSSSIPVG